MSEAVPYPARPPTSNELVFPDDEPMESARHFHQMNILVYSLEDAWRDRTDFYVGGNMFLYFSETQSRRNDFRGPDVFVVLDTDRRERRAWVVWEEGGRAPDVIIELLSETTEKIDRGEKMRVYGSALRVGEYFLFDPFTGVLEGYELHAPRARYVRKVEDELGRLRCERLGLLLGKVRSNLYGTEADWLRWMTLEGRVLDLSAERANAEAERANAEAERANAEAERANAEAERAERLAAELTALRRQLDSE
jgi:Uma2 family endonuclease